MSASLLAWVALVLLGVAMLTNTSFAKRQILRAIEQRVGGADRFVDVGVTLHVVVADPAGDELIKGKPRLRILRTHRFGGIVDTKALPPRMIGPSRQPRTWYCSEDQEAIVLHRDGEPLGQLVYGSEGAGKTTCAGIWVYLRWLELLGERREIGVTAPTETRLGLLLRELTIMYPPAWFTYQASSGVLTLCDGTRCRLVSTYRQSKAQGSPVQGFNWSACVRDEGQDQVDVHEDIESRGRAARDGAYKQLITATAKDDPNWRTLRDQLDAGRDKVGRPLWVRRTLYGRRSPFVDPGFWDAKRLTMSPREYARRVDAKDVGPERSTYPNWSRDTNLITVPDLGWVDVTQHELRGSGPNFKLLVGHDPGLLIDVSILLKAYVRNQTAYARGLERPMWIVLDEVNTEQGTTEGHIKMLLERVRRDHRLNLLSSSGKYNPTADQMLVRADPAGNSDTRTDKSVYTQFANAGVRIKPAAYNATNDGHGRVPLEPGIELVNTLLCNAEDPPVRRLFIARKPDGSPAAPRLAAALEMAERDAGGKADAQRKDKRDTSHWPAALRYALWAIERPRLQLLTEAES